MDACSIATIWPALGSDRLKPKRAIAQHLTHDAQDARGLTPVGFLPPVDGWFLLKAKSVRASLTLHFLGGLRRGYGYGEVV